MKNLCEVSRHYLKLVAEADRKENTSALIAAQGGRNIYFWDARKFAKDIGINDLELEQVVRFLSERDLIHWRHHFGIRPTVELTEKGFRWELHQGLFDSDPVMKSSEMRSPWASGSFYLVAIIALALVIRVTFGQVSAWWLPIVLVFGILGCTVIGSFQLINDRKVSEKGFIQIMALVFRSLPLIRMLIPKKKE